ncbi:response regulator [Pseudoroseomonas wenyumeiae]
MDDEAPLRRLAQRALRRAGHDVVVAEDAETALTLLEEGLVPGHLVSDVAMPGMDGVALARAMRRGCPVCRCFWSAVTPMRLWMAGWRKTASASWPSPMARPSWSPRWESLFPLNDG